ncbi:MAG: hypothetical protein QM817_28200 [Archangium sp.]
MRWVALVLSLVCFGACGPSDGRLTTKEPPTSGPEFRLDGACSPSSVSRAVTVDSRETSCLRGTPPPTLVETQEQLDQLLVPNCVTTQLSDQAAIDFSTHRALVISSRGADEWFLFPNFVQERSDAVEVGLVIRPQGFPPPDHVLVLPKNGLPIELRWCRSVCVAWCDQAIP